MQLNRRHLAVAALGFLGARGAAALPVDDKTIAEKLEQFRVAMIAKNAKVLDALTAPQLSYGHSTGVVQDKHTFMEGATSAKSKWNSLSHIDTTIRVVGTAAIVRFKFVAENETADGKKTPINIGILMVWQKQGTTWKLLARQSVKL